MNDIPPSVTTTIRCSTAEKLLDKISPRSRYKKLDNPHEVLFRGHADERFQLIPTALRSFGSKGLETNVDQVDYEVDLIKSFYWLADSCGLPLPEDSQNLRNSIFRQDRLRSYSGSEAGDINWPPPEIWSLLALAQHHGLETRLLDWSLDAKRAAYFAAVEAARWVRQPETAPAGVENLAVWALDHTDIMFDEFISFLYDERVSFLERFSVITAPSAGNKNLHAQKGVFTLYRPPEMKSDGPVDARPLNLIIEQDQIDVTLKKFVLPIAHAPSLLKLLAFEGASGADLFPGYDGIVKGLREKVLWPAVK